MTRRDNGRTAASFSQQGGPTYDRKRLSLGPMPKEGRSGSARQDQHGHIGARNIEMLRCMVVTPYISGLALPSLLLRSKGVIKVSYFKMRKGG